MRQTAIYGNCVTVMTIFDLRNATLDSRLAPRNVLKGFETFVRSYLRGKRNPRRKGNDFDFFEAVDSHMYGMRELVVRGGHHLSEGLHVLAA